MSWIKIRTTLPDDPRVARIARLLNVEPNTVVGALVRIWAYADAHSTDGALPWTQAGDIDRIAGIGIADAMRAVDWLLDHVDGGVSFPRFGEHNGETAKARAQGARRVAAHRARNADTVTGSRNGGVIREEKRREEKKPRASARVAPAGRKGGI